MNPNSLDSWLARIEEHLTNQDAHLERIEKHVSHTNGRVTDLEKWRNWLAGSLATITFLGGMYVAIHSAH